MTVDLKQWRTNRGLTQIDLAKLLKRSLKTISNWEMGAYVPADLDAQLEALAIAGKVANVVDDETVYITPTNHPELYTPIRVDRRIGYHRKPEHPGYGHYDPVPISALKK